MSLNSSGRRSAAEVFRDRFCPGLNVQLFINVPEVGANGVDADVELVADLLVGQPLG